MNVIEFESVSKRFRLQEGQTVREFMPAFLAGRGWSLPFYALDNVSFQVEQGETFGIIGRNGSGKSTILKLIAGVMAPTNGQARVAGRVCPLIELGAGFHPDLTGRENVFLNASILGLSGRQIRSRFDEIVDFSELAEFMDTPVKRYSSGMYVRLGFAIAVHSDPDILLVDEVLSVGDGPFQQKCLKKMREIQNRGVTIVLVTHGLSLVESFCHRALLLNSGRAEAEGTTSEVVRRYQETMSQTSDSEVSVP